jgi:TonB family protein
MSSNAKIYNKNILRLKLIMIKNLILLTIALSVSYFAGAQIKATDTSAVLNYADNMPEPPTEMSKYLSDHITYPEDAHKKKVAGKVVVRFIVDEEGNVTHATIARGVYRSLDSIALQVVSSMPKWKPGMQGGKLVKVYYNLPIVFKMEDDNNDTTKIFAHADQMPQPTFSIPQYLNMNLKYPAYAIQAGIEGTVMVRYVVNEQGKVCNAIVEKPVSPLLDSEAIRVTMNMPLFKPGMNMGKLVKVYYRLPVTFDLKSNMLTKLEDSAYNNDEMPSFPDINNYLSKNIHYPIEAREANVQGRVVVKFIVNEDGMTDSVIVLKSVLPVLDREAVRIVKTMPRWKPGKHNGVPVKVYFTLPIIFTIEDGSVYQGKSLKNENIIDTAPVPTFNLVDYLHTNLNYPEDAKSKKIEGEVVIGFVVKADGRVDEVQIVQHAYPSLDKEALRLGRELPTFEPAMKNGKPIKIGESLKITFKL